MGWTLPYQMPEGGSHKFVQWYSVSCLNVLFRNIEIYHLLSTWIPELLENWLHRSIFRLCTMWDDPIDRVRWSYLPCKVILWTVWGDPIDRVRWYYRPCEVILWTVWGDPIDRVRWSYLPCKVILWTVWGDPMDRVRWSYRPCEVIL
jgi:hypothetical protein